MTGFGILRVKRFQRRYGGLSTIIFDPGMTLWISRTFCARTEQLRTEKLRLTYCIPYGKEIETKLSSLGSATRPCQSQF